MKATMKTFCRAALGVSLAMVLGCGPTGDGGGALAADASPSGSVPDGGSSQEFIDAAPMQQCEKMDLVFVIDNSGSMGQEQDNLALNFPQFISVLDQSGLDYRVAVTTTGVDYSYTLQTPIGSLNQDQDGGDNGAFRMECGMSRRWIEKTDADAAATFACVAKVGTNGPSDEMPLGAMRRGLSDRISDGTNVGFLRPDALLGIVILTDENDCSYQQSVSLSFGQDLCDSGMEPVPSYVDFLDQLTGDRGRWATAVIAGPGPGACSSAFGNADEASRLVDFVNQTGANGVMSSICEGDLTVGLAAALATFTAACENFPPID